MKYLKYIFIYSVLAAVFVACSDDYLVEDPATGDVPQVPAGSWIQALAIYFRL